MRTLVILLASCATSPETPTTCERLADDRGAECATVYSFVALADNPLGRVELCVPDRLLSLAERRYGHAEPSEDERFKVYRIAGLDPPCFWCCSGECPQGANAYGGSFCPPTESP